jgi:hypothetical protein
MTIVLQNTSDTINTVTSEANSSDPNGQKRGQIDRVLCTAHPTQNTTVGIELVQFSLPFTRKEVLSIKDLKAFASDGTTEIKINVKEGLRWFNWDDSPTDSLRSAIVTVELTFADTTTPVTFYIAWGEGEPTLTLPDQPNQLNWVDYRTSGKQYVNLPLIPDVREPQYDFDATGYGYPTENILEPRTWVTLPSEYLRYSEVFTPYSEYSTRLDSELTLCKQFLDKGFESMYNYNGAHIREGFAAPFMMDTNSFREQDQTTGKASEGSGYATWLFDRASVFAHKYVMSGNINDLIIAHRNMYYYATKLVNGVYTPKSNALGQNDEKYIYSRPIVTDNLLVGTTEHMYKIAQLDAPWETFDHIYRVVDTNASHQFWTERHAAYKMAHYLAKWEYTGSQEAKQDVLSVFNELYRMQQTPDNSWVKDGSFRHTVGSHEGFGGYSPCGSPWMSNLVLGVVVTYYEHSKDTRALTMMYDLYRYLIDNATYEARSLVEYQPDDTYPRYLFGVNGYTSEANSESDAQHAFDVLHICARGLWAAEILGHDTSADLATIRALKHSAYNVFSQYIREGQDTLDAGYTTYRVEPIRKGNWWWGSQNFAIFRLLEDL